MRNRKQQRGYVMFVVMVLLLVMVAAGAYGLSAMDTEMKATASFRKQEQLSRGAEAGAAHRLAEVAVTKDPLAILDEVSSDAGNQWNDWPAGFVSAGADVTNLLQYRTTPVQFIWRGNTPPPGVTLGTPTYLFNVDSFAVLNADDSGEAAVTVGFKTWDLLPSSYGP